MSDTSQSNHAECANPGNVIPVINFGRCEGKADCVVVCPYDVFEVRRATAAERNGLSFREGLKSLVHGHQKAFVVNGDACHACGLCVHACPEKAILLRRVDGTAAF